MNVFYSTNNGERTGRASNFFRSEPDAVTIAAGQSEKAIEMGIKARYEVASCDDSTVVDKKSIR